MPCYKPLTAWQSKNQGPNGKSSIIFQPPKYKSQYWKYIQLPCGRCIGCRLERSRQWAIRCMHEAQMHPENCFITLTFSDKYLNPTGTLVKSDFQKFMKRLRKANQPKKIRFLHAGEYGEQHNRPHHHALLFNHDFPDKTHWRTTDQKHKVYRSHQLEKLWPFGHCEIGELTFESAAYVARYCCKKQETSDLKLPRLCSRIDGKTKEYNTMSRRPGIAANWIQKYGESDVWALDQIVIRGGVPCKPPKFYTQKYELTNPQEYAILKQKRLKEASENPDNTWVRLATRETCKKAQIKQLKRNL